MKKTFIITTVAVFILLVIILVLMVPGKKKPLNLVLITVDTLRPDHLGYNGYSRNTSPAIDGLAREGLVFDESYSVSGWTLPSIATILTGMYPRDHGATDLHWSVDEDLNTLASVLQSNGYHTMGFVSHVMLKPIYGFGRGFESYDYSVLNIGHPHDVSTSKELTDLAIQELRKAEQPFFLWVHYFDPHFRYLPHEGWEGFGSSDVDRYDQEVAFTDYHISRLLSYLKRKRLYDESIIVFTADHGEEFGEHGGEFHYTLYQEVLRTPLIIRAPFLKAGLNHTTVRQIDLLPTILSLLNVDYNRNAYPGRNVLEAGGENEPIFVERDRPPPYNQRGVMLGGYKLFVVEPADTSVLPVGSRGTYAPVTNVHEGIYMYNLEKDPAERQNIYGETDPIARKLLVKIGEYASAKKKKTRELKIDKELTEKLRSLGYIR